MIAILRIGILIYLMNPLHDATIAVFKLRKQNDKVHLEIKCDIQDYSTCYKVGRNNIIKSQIEKVVNAESDWVFDGAEGYVKVDSFEYVNDHLHIHALVERVSPSTKNVIIVNRFLNAIDGQSNIIQLDLNDVSKDYRMHSGRSKIEINY